MLIWQMARRNSTAKRNKQDKGPLFILGSISLAWRFFLFSIFLCLFNFIIAGYLGVHSVSKETRIIIENRTVDK